MIIRMGNKSDITVLADWLSGLYRQKFGGKESGRFRLPAKLLRQAAKRRRLYEDDILALSRELLERGYVLVDMDTFYVVLSANTFVNYRRANEDCLKDLK